MFTEGYSFPHPVLGNDDDIQGEFHIDMDIERTINRKIKLENISILITNEFINKLLDNGDAQLIIKLYCSSTLSTWVFESPFQSIEIDENDLVNKIEIQVFIIASKTIADFSHGSFHQQFNSGNFVVNENDVVGISGKITFPIEKKNEKLGLGNIFKFFHHNTEKPMNFEHHHDKIYINYPVTKKGDHPPKALFETKPWTAFNIFIIPALAEALRYISENPKEVENLEWYQIVDSLLPEEERTSNYYSQAQEIIEGEVPLLICYNELMK